MTTQTSGSDYEMFRSTHLCCRSNISKTTSGSGKAFPLNLPQKTVRFVQLDESGAEKWLTKTIDLSLLQGRTEYGDSIEDEWMVVWLLRELTKEFENLWVKVVDNDGEFLLIEAAETLPKWLEPEIANNRVSDIEVVS